MATWEQLGELMLEAEDNSSNSTGDPELEWPLLIGMVLGQAFVWVILYHRKGPCRRAIHSWVEGNEERMALVVKNAADVPTSGGQGDEGLLKEWSFWTVIGIHHGLGAFFALLSLIFDNVFLFRLGISFEIGEDFLHYIELAYALMCPPGTEIFGEMYTGCTIRIGMVCHHAIGFFGGSFCFLAIPDWWQVQACVLLLLGAAVPQLVHYPAMPFTDLTKFPLDALGRACTWTIVIGTMFALLGRIFVFPWLAYEIAYKVYYTPEYGPNVAYFLVGVSLIFCVFIVGTSKVCGQYAIDCAQLLWGPKPAEDATEEEKEAYGKARSKALLSGVQASMVPAMTKDSVPRRRNSLIMQDGVGVEI